MFKELLFDEVSLEMWKHKVTGVDGNIILFGVNIFDYEWTRTGEEIEITDPVYKQKHIFSVYKAHIRGREYTFAAGEFSNCVWGFYTRRKFRLPFIKR